MRIPHRLLLSGGSAAALAAASTLAGALDGSKLPMTGAALAGLTVAGAAAAAVGAMVLQGSRARKTAEATHDG